jgi:hypothetical protein
LAVKHNSAEWGDAVPGVFSHWLAEKGGAQLKEGAWVV